jgi:hypothetical protein
MEVAKEKRRAVQKRDNNHRLYIFPENLFMYIQFLTKTYFSILSLAFPLPYDIYSKKKYHYSNPIILYTPNLFLS